MPRPIDSESFDSYRAQARDYADKRNEYARLSREAYINGNGWIAKEYSNKRKEMQQHMESTNALAASKIFMHNNSQRPDTEIDLHGLYVPEAIERLKERVIMALNQNWHELIVIVGRGLHSEGGPKIRPAVIKFASQHGLSYELPNPGRIRFEFVQLSLEHHETETTVQPSATLPEQSLDPVYSQTKPVEHPRTTPFIQPIVYHSSDLVQNPRPPSNFSPHTFEEISAGRLPSSSNQTSRTSVSAAFATPHTTNQYSRGFCFSQNQARHYGETPRTPSNFYPPISVSNQTSRRLHSDQGRTPRESNHGGTREKIKMLLWGCFTIAIILVIVMISDQQDRKKVSLF